MLQIFTYWTGLALTGRSAACAPAIATIPAAEPRRRLFTIFILNLQVVVRGRVPSPPDASHPGRSPSVPVTAWLRKTSPSQTGRPWDAPRRRTLTLTERNLLAMNKRPFEQTPI